MQRLERELPEARARLTERACRLAGLELEAAILALRFRLPAPDLPRTGKGGSPFLLSDFIRIEPQEDGETVRVVGPSGKRAITGDTGRILALAGPWERTSAEATAEQREKMREQEAALQAERDEVDDFLRELLKDGPAARERIIAAAEEAGIPVRSTPNARGASLLDVRKRLGCLPLETRDGSKTPFWSLPDVPWNEDAFTLYQAEIERGAGAGAGMR